MSIAEEDPFPWFTKSCLNACSILVSKYGFQDPEIEQIGRERFVRYSRGKHTVSIAYESGTLPMVELFYTSRDMRDRVIPGLKTSVPEKLAKFNRHHHKLCRAQKYQEADSLVASQANALQPEMETYLRNQMAALEVEAKAFLEGKEP